MIPVFRSRDNSCFMGFKGIAIDGFSCPTQKVQVTKLALFIRMLGGKLGKAKHTGQS